MDNVGVPNEVAAPVYAFRHNSLSVPVERIWLDGVLATAPDVRGLVILVQNGCVLHTELREAMIARRCEEARFATLAIDLLSRYEDQRDPDARYNIALMGSRLLGIAEWLAHQPELRDLPLAIAASGTPCGAAVRASARLGERVAALVCRSGRPDLAGAAPLRALRSPTRFIVGGEDATRARYQQPAFDLLTVARDWQEVPAASDDFRAPGALERAAQLTVDWLARHLPATAPVVDSADPPPSAKDI